MVLLLKFVGLYMICRYSLRLCLEAVEAQEKFDRECLKRNFKKSVNIERGTHNGRNVGSVVWCLMEQKQKSPLTAEGPIYTFTIEEEGKDPSQPKACNVPNIKKVFDSQG